MPYPPLHVLFNLCTVQRGDASLRSTCAATPPRVALAVPNSEGPRFCSTTSKYVVFVV